LLELIKLGSDGDEAQMELATKVISQTPVVVVDTQVRPTHFTHPQLLLLVA